MSTVAVRLEAAPEGSAGVVVFAALFAAPEEDTEAAIECLAAEVVTGDGHRYDAGLVCPPTAVTWREQRRLPLASHAYRGAGPYTAELVLDGVVAASVVVQPAQAPARGLEETAASEAVPLFAIAPIRDEPAQRTMTLHAPALQPGQRLRVDAGAGQVRELAGEEGQVVTAEMVLAYPKPGLYLVTVDLLDGEGFWLETLAQTPLEIAGPEVEDIAASPVAIPEAVARDAVAAHAVEPWLPYRNFKPRTSGARTYSQPGGGTVRRVVGTGVWMTARRETTADGYTWYQTASSDWIRADAVTFFKPSALRGVLLDPAAPPPPVPEPPPPSEERQGVVTASSLNVRARPGVASSNPPVAILRAGAKVTIYEEQRLGSETWYRIGADRWVSGAYVRITGDSQPTPPPSGRRGIVTATVLNVRARPGVSATNPPVASLRAGAEVTIYEERAVSGAAWYRIGTDRWVIAQWVRILETVSQSIAQVRLADQKLGLPLGWVVPDTLDVRAQPGVGTGNPVIAQFTHNQVLPILEETTVSGARWYRVAEQQWVEARQVGVARKRARPSSIGPNALWVAVNLSQQTVVAYEGDQPVFAALAATGLPGTPTVQGIFRTHRRLDTGKMSGPGYYIEDVTWTCYFYAGYALHTAYWHDKFGRPRSHGCVNLSPYDAWWIYQWSAKGGANSPMVYVYHS